MAHVYDGVENERNAGWYNGARTIYLAIQRQPGTNTVEVVDRIKAVLPQLKEQLPASVDLQVRSDRSIPIRDSVNDVKFTLQLTVVLVVLVIFLFLRNVSATVIPSLALPFSIVGTFAVMYLLGYSLDNLSLMALTLSVGFVVDDAIVMLENIVRHMEMGKARLQAALDGSKEIAFTIVSMTLSLAAVFIPVLFMGGVVGRLMHEFAVTIGAAILVSGLVSLTLTPMLCSRFLKAPHAVRHGWFYNVMERMFEAWLRGYSWSLRQTIRFKGATMAVSGLLLAGTVYLFTIIPMGFIPSVDTGQLSGQVETLQGLGFDATVARVKDVMNVLAHDENVAGYTANVFGSGGRLNVDLQPREARSLTADQVIESLRPKLARIPGIRVFLVNPPSIRIGGMMTRSQYQFTLQDPDTDELYRSAAGFETALRSVEGIEDVTSDLQIRNPQLDVDLDRDQIAALGLTVDQVETALTSSYGTRAGLADLRARRPVPGHPAGGAALPARSGRAVAALSHLADGHAGAALRGRADPPDGRPALGEPHRAVAVGDPVVQPQAGRGARRRRDAGAGAGARHAARDDLGQLPGDGAGVPGLDDGPRLGARPRDLRHLRRAGHPLRELHPPADDPLRPAGGRFRRAADADPLPVTTSTSTPSSA